MLFDVLFLWIVKLFGKYTKNIPNHYEMGVFFEIIYEMMPICWKSDEI